MEKLTIHRALSELKTINARIERLIESLQPSGVMQKGKLVNGTTQLEDFNKDALSRFQSVVDLIDRRNKIKSAIVKANGVTLVKVATREMSIADAINAKAIATLRAKFIETMQKKHSQAKASLEKNNAQVDANALQLATVALQKQGIKIGDDDAQKVIGPFLEANRFSLVDPLGADKKVEEMAKELGDFLSEVDAVLSEINAVTFIEF